MPALSKPLLAWFERHGRHDLPWQHDVSAYRVWLSEIMLQQTQVATVIPYFERFTNRFAGVGQLAAAPLDEVLHLWSGLGYYARARNLHRTANVVVADHGGRFPRDIDALLGLPGIGRSTAGAILSLVYGDPHPILDGNVKRVLARYHGIAGWPGETRVANQLWEHAARHTPNARVGEYTQAIMDLGATVCTRSRPRCETCPLRGECVGFANATQSDFPGRKPRKVLPERSTRFVIARDEDNRFLLSRRPPHGVWGGLWSFPELDPDDMLDRWCAVHGLRPAGDPIEQPVVQHTFTHFRLTITPLEIAVDHSGAVMDSDRWLWYNVDEPNEVGLAKPVATLLQRAQSTQQTKRNRP
tara:strand:- start:2345 stop:3412 length:1068 start_codon:yes stop_codon:yes gene_type:complete